MLTRIDFERENGNKKNDMKLRWFPP